MTSNIPDISGGIDRRKVTDHEEYFNGLFPEKPVYVPIFTSQCSNNSDEMLVTTVGTGIAICINDKALGMSGLAHLFIPEALKSDPSALQEQQEKILEELIDTLIKSGSSPEQMKAKLFGSSQLTETSSNDGTQTHNFVKDFLSNAGITVSIEEIGSNVGRRIHFFPKSGKVVRRLLQRQADRVVLLEREEKFNGSFSG